MRSTSPSPHRALALAAGLAAGASMALHAADPPPAPAERRPATQDAGHPERSPFTIDFVSLGDPVTGALRRRVEGFTQDVEDSAQQFTQVVMNRENRRTIHFTIEATRAADNAPPTVFRIERRVVLAWPEVTPSELMADAHDRHGGTPACQSYQRDAAPGSGTALMLKAFARGGLFDQAPDQRSDARPSDRATACVWGGADIIGRGEIACDAACLSASVVYPTPSTQLLRLDEVAYDPNLDPAG